ncbi:MAG: hypothetical protein ACI9LM_004594 [Alteromonadaceae bacterium]|jgi:hypothetical protein
MLHIIPVITSMLATITKVAVTIGPTIAKYAPMLLEMAGKYLPQIIKTVETVCTVLNIVSPNERAEDLGAKAMNAEKKPEDFDKINDYIDYLRQDVSVDKTTLSEDPINVTARQVIGSSLMIKAAGEVLGTELTLPFIKTVSQLDLDANVIVEVAKAYSNSALNLNDFDEYITDTLSLDESDKHSNALVYAYQKTDSSMTVEQAEDRVMDLALPTNSL